MLMQQQKKEKLEALARLGVVGAGGAGFPTLIKYQEPAEILLVNAAECEPLLHKDQELCKEFPRDLIAGAQLAFDLLDAKETIIGIKGEYKEAIAALDPHLPNNFRLHLLGSHYPAGDEFVLVYEATGRLVPPGGLPKDVGCVVNNVETLVNLALNRPVTNKYLTIGGAVARPQTLCAPIGASMADCLAACGGATVNHWAALEGGVLMGQLHRDPQTPVSKTTGCFIILPQEHPLLARYSLNLPAVNRRARAACDQCTFCTELCPRHLLGHPIQPHMAMRALGFALAESPGGAVFGASTAAAGKAAGANYCCECNLCSLIACPEDLDPKSVMVQAKQQKAELSTSKGFQPHPLYPARRQPLSRIKARLGLTQFEDSGPLNPEPLNVDRVCIALRQGFGAPGKPVVKVGDRVSAGQLIANPPAGQLGAPLHASLGGIVRQVSQFIEIEQ